jgi:hypothetical protein
MQEGNYKKTKRGRGRPRTSNLDAQQQSRLRKRRQRANLVKQAVSKVEIWLPATLKTAIRRAGGKKTMSDIGQEAFKIWLKNQK